LSTTEGIMIRTDSSLKISDRLPFTPWPWF
jgi:hypothetical protein